MSNEVARQGANRYIRQWAILMPNGELYGQPIQVPVKGEPVEDFSVPSSVRDMMGMGGLFMMGAAKAPRTVTVIEPVIFTTREAAAEALTNIAAHAEQLGVTHWGGIVVERLCTPFIGTDPGVAFRDEIIDWIQQQGEQPQ